jgi:hypothetical protein
LTADGDHSDVIMEQDLLQNEDLQTGSFVMPFHYSAEQVLESVNGRKGE